MKPKIKYLTTTVVLVSVLLSLAFTSAPSPRAYDGTPPPTRNGRHRFIMFAKSVADFASMRAEAQAAGATIVQELPQVNSLVVMAPTNFRGQVANSTHLQGVVPDQLRSLIRTNMNQEMFGAPFQTKPALNRNKFGHGGNGHGQSITPDPANSLPGLMWNLDRIHAPKAWKVNAGDAAVTVAVADTGLDFTHPELASKVTDVVDLTATEDPPICSTYYGYSDANAAADFGGPETTDWNGHGSWIGGNIAAALDGQGINGIAPKVNLVALKISQWCGSAYDSTILDAFVYAADHGIDIVSISFGGYLDRSDPDQDLIYQAYVSTVAYAMSKGTVIVAAAGNEHVKVGPGGLVLSHGSLTIPGDPVDDLFGLYEVPGGIPGVVDVSATGNVVARPSVNCPAGTADNSSATCKPKSDAHQPTGIGKRDQLTYYSNYGPRIDVAAPGGARKFNVPAADRGGTAGFPVTDADDYTAYEDFSITSNWSLEIPCYFFDPGPYFYADSCYSSIQGTSMATPHASAVLALIASNFPRARHHPLILIGLLKAGATRIDGNTTPGLSATDTSPADLTGVACTSGYCHLGGRAISDNDAYGAGLVDAFGSLRP